MLKAAIFDIDGTLLDSVDQHAQAWQDTFQHFGFEFLFDQIRGQIGKGGDKLLGTFLNPEQYKSLKTEMEKYRTEIFKKNYLASCKPFPEVRSLLEALRARNVKIALGSSAKKDEIEVYKTILQIGSLVDKDVSGDEVSGSKPDPDIVTEARHILGDLKAPDCCFIGDSPYDATAAVQDGTKMIAVLCGGFLENDLRSAGASEIFQDPSDLLKRWVATLQ